MLIIISTVNRQQLESLNTELKGKTPGLGRSVCQIQGRDIMGGMYPSLPSPIPSNISSIHTLTLSPRDA
jgi:hypothetical protein